MRKHPLSPKLAIFLVVFIDLLGFGVMIPMLPFFVRHFGQDAFHVGWLMFVYSFMQIFVSPLWGQISDRIGRRPVLLLTIAGQALAFLWGGFSTTYMSLLWSRIFAGVFSANISTANAYIADITTPDERAKGMGMIGAAFGLGFIFGPAIGGLLIPYGYSWPFFFAAALSAVNFFWAVYVLAEPVDRTEERKANRRRINFEAFKKTMTHPDLIYPILLFFLMTLAFTQMEITFGLFMMDEFHFSERDAGLVFAAMGVVMAIVQGGLIGKLVKFLSEQGVIRVGLPLVALGLLGLIISGSKSQIDLGFQSGLPALFTGLLVMAIGYSLVNPCLSSWTSKLAPPRAQGTTLGIYQSAGSVARVIGPPLAGYFYRESTVGSFVSALAIVFLAQILFFISRWWRS